MLSKLARSGNWGYAKTPNLVDRVKLEQAAGHKVQVFHPREDSRTLPDFITSHDNKVIESQAVECSEELKKLVEIDTCFVAIDEAQFFDPSLVNVCLDLTQQGKHLLIAGLDLNFKGLPFGPMPQLLACASQVHKYSARCRYPGCQQYAIFSQRLVDGRPASYYEKEKVIGGEELYEPR